MSRLTAAELAEGAGTDEQSVLRLAELGILQSDAGRFESRDVHLLRLATAFEDAGVPLEPIGEAIRAGEFDYSNLTVLFQEPPTLTTNTYGQLARHHDRPFEWVTRLATAVGLPQPGPDERVRADDADALTPFLSGWSMVEPEEALRLARIYGDALRNAAESVVRLFETTVSARVESLDVPASEKARQIGAIASGMLDAVESLITWLNRRHLERYVFQSSVTATEAELERRGAVERRPERNPAIAFLDLTGYTRLTEERGDEAAAELASRLSEAVVEAAREHGGRPVKWLGDGVMFHFSTPTGAVKAALELVDRTPALGLPPSRVGVSAGSVIFRDGDYFGRTVNLASRAADYARPSEVLVTDPVRTAVDAPELRFEPLHPVALKGVSQPVELYRASGPAGRRAVDSVR